MIPEPTVTGPTVEELPGGTLLSVPGLRGAAVACGLKEDGQLDLAVVVADAPRTAAAVTTRSELAAAPVRLLRHQLQVRPRVRTVVVNAGNANALTGPRGWDDAEAMTEQAARRAGPPATVLSTGVIGVPMPMDRIRDGIERACSAPVRDAGLDVARAMMTTDTLPKTCAHVLDVPGSGRAARYTVGGVAKGSGMIHPDMGTMLAIVATDAEVTPAALQRILRSAADRSFHEISVDGDTSTNDAVLLLAGGSGDPPIDVDDARIYALERGIAATCRRLAREIVRDGEGVSRLMDLRVSGARTRWEARRVASTIACSPLVKTALAGGDPNWGRILAAAARAGVSLDEGRLALTLGHQRVYDGRPLAADEDALQRTFAEPEVQVELSLGEGEGEARLLTGDLTERYIQINAEYRT